MNNETRKPPPPQHPGEGWTDSPLDEEEFTRMDAAREAVRTGRYTAADAERNWPSAPPVLSPDWWRADPAGLPRWMGQVVFEMGVGTADRATQVRVVSAYLDSHEGYTDAIPSYIRHQFAAFLRGEGYAPLRRAAPADPDDD